MSDRELPDMPDGLTADWLTAALQDAQLLPPDGRVSQVTLSQVGDGTGMMSELAHLTLSVDGDRGEVPETLVAKFSSRNPQNREVAMSFNLYERETRYFRELDGRTLAHSPRVVVNAFHGDRFLLLMEDMSGYRVGDQEAGADLDDTLAMTDELAKLHASFWGRVDDLDWVPGIANSYHADNMQALVRIGWPVMVATFGECLSTDHQAMGDVFADALPKLQAAMFEAPRTLLHGDFRMENVFFGTHVSQVPVSIFDWQGPLLGKGINDVSLMLTQSTVTEVRRAHERAVLQRYVDGLARHGVEGYDIDQALADYQLSVLYNWVYVAVVAGTLDTTNAKAFAWMSQMLKRHDAASADFNCLAALSRY